MPRRSVPSVRYRAVAGVLESDMSKHVRYVVNHPDGWAVKSKGARQASSVHHTQDQAVTMARLAVISRGGGEVHILGRDGKWCESQTIARGSDPFPTREMR